MVLQRREERAAAPRVKLSLQVGSDARWSVVVLHKSSYNATMRVRYSLPRLMRRSPRGRLSCESMATRSEHGQRLLFNFCPVMLDDSDGSTGNRLLRQMLELHNRADAAPSVGVAPRGARGHGAWLRPDPRRHIMSLTATKERHGQRSSCCSPTLPCTTTSCR